jgi:hypothetical protein
MFIRLKTNGIPEDCIMRKGIFVIVLSVLIWMLLLIGIQLNCYSQPVGWSDDIRLTDAPLISANPSIAVDGNNLYVVWQDARNNESYDDYEIYFKKSTDNGKTWSEEMRLSNGPHYSDYPKVAVNGNNIHVIWTDDRNLDGFDIYYNRSNDGGETWLGEERICPATASGSPGYLDIAVNGSNVHVVYGDCSEALNSDFHIYYINSSDNGQTWSTRQRLTSLIRNPNHPSMAVNDNNVHIVWMDHYDKNGQGTAGAIFYMNSTDGGLTWSEDFNLTPMNLDAAYPDIVVNGNIIHVTFSEEVSGIWETHYRRSEDGGISWSEDTQLTDWNRDHWGSSIDVYGANVSIVWWTSWIQEPDGNGEIYYINSSDNGYSWGENLRLTYDPESAGQADISLSVSFINIVWNDKRDGNVEIYYKQYPVYADLSISPDDITFSTDIPNIGIPTQINATIQNIGNENASATIELWDGDPDNGGVFIDSTDVTVNITESVNATINWIPSTNGSHNIYVKITNTLETNLSNNIANKSVMVNREPELDNIPSTFTLSEDTIENQLINLSEYVSDDLDSWDELTFSVISYSNSSFVRVSIFDGHFLSVDALTGSANDNWTGTIEIVIEVTDTYDLINISNQFTVTVTEVNDAPVVINPIPNLGIDEDTSASTTVNLANVFFDSDNSSLYYTYSGNANVSVIINDNGSVTFTPYENWTGDETIIFFATDNLSSPVSDNVTVSITPVNDAPVVVDTISDFNMDEDTVVKSIINLTEIFQDVDNATLYYFYSGNINISVIIHKNGSVTFILAENWSGSETITFYTTDNLSSPIPEDVTITVIGINDPPIITILSPSNNSNHLTSDTVYFNITVFDVDSESFTYLWDFGDGNTSSMKSAMHQFSEAGIYNVSIIVNDGLDSETKMVTIVVEPKTTNGNENGVIDDDGSDTLTYLWILMGIIIVVLLLLLFIWRRSKTNKNDNEIEINSVEDENELSE